MVITRGIDISGHQGTSVVFSADNQEETAFVFVKATGGVNFHQTQRSELVVVGCPASWVAAVESTAGEMYSPVERSTVAALAQLSLAGATIRTRCGRTASGGS